MKKFRLLSLLAIAVLLAAGFTSCKPKDADIQKAVQTAIAANPDATGVTVAVEKGIVTLTGEVKDDATSLVVAGLATAVKGVKSVTNSLTVTPPAPVLSPIDAALETALKDALKDNATVIAAVKDGVITLTGEIQKKDLPKLLQKISALKPIKIDNQLTVK